MNLIGFSLNNLSLMAITLAVGFVVDDAIVVLENITRHMEMGKDRLQAALEGAKEIGSTVITMTVSLSAVFLPILFMEGMVGRLFREFAVTVGIAVLISGLVSLSITPMMCSLILRHEHAHGRLFNFSENIFNAAKNGYVATLRWVLNYRGFVLLGSLGVLRRDRLALHSGVKRFHSAPGHRRDQRQHARARRHHLRRNDSLSAGGRRNHSEESECRGGNVDGRTGGRRRAW